VSHRRFTHAFRRAPMVRAIVAATVWSGARTLCAQATAQPTLPQQATVPASAPPALAPHRATVIALVQPAAGGRA
jgi:hypothetical protein